MNPDPNAIDWNADVTTTPEQEYRVLLKSLRRAQGFKLLFVQCAPAEGQRLIAQVREDLPPKRIDVLPLKTSIDNLYDLVVPYKDQTDILFISGLEQSLYDYEKERLWSEDGIYRFDAEAEKQRYETGVPRVLSHLNLSRERFQRDVPICLVFLVPTYALKYLIRRAPDFFDWRSGVLEFIADPQVVEQESQRIVFEGDYEQYLTWTPEDRVQRILEIQSWLEEPHQKPERKAKLLFEQGNLFVASEAYQSAIASYDKSVAIDQNDHRVWYNLGGALVSLERYKESIATYDHAIAIKPDYHEAWHNRSSSLFNLRRYEEAIASYDRVVDIKPDDPDAWYVRGIALGNLGRYEEAIASYDKAIEFKPDNHAAWCKRGDALAELGRKEEAIANYDKALEIKPDYSQAWNSRGYTFFELGQYAKAISNFKEALQIKQDDDKVLSNLAAALGRLGQREEALTYCDEALAFNPANGDAWFDRGISLAKLDRHEEAIASYDRAIALKPDDYQAWYNRGAVLINLRRYGEAIKSFEQAIELNPDYGTFRFMRSNLLRSLLNVLGNVWLKCKALFGAANN